MIYLSTHSDDYLVFCVGKIKYFFEKTHPKTKFQTPFLWKFKNKVVENVRYKDKTEVDTLFPSKSSFPHRH